jgi:predicted DCC family thiol-disulfide oxidoreductase YuxK
MKKSYPVLLVDSECAVCNRSVQLIRRHLGRDEKILFRSLFSEEGIKYLKKHNLPEDYRESLVLIDQGKIYLKSDAVLRIAGKMKGIYPLLSVFMIVPRRIRDIFYDLLAKHRHKLL